MQFFKSQVHPHNYALRQGEGHIAAVGITITKERQKHFDFGPPYQEVNEELICYRNSKRVGDAGDIAGLEIVVPAQSSYIRTLEKLQTEYPGIYWKTNTRLLTPQLMKKVTTQPTRAKHLIFWPAKKSEARLQMHHSMH